MGTLFYSSNNSGGDWWLSDEDWIALEQAGWHVYWLKDTIDNKWLDPDGRWLGALAKEAAKHFEYEHVGIAEFESITNQNSENRGCECCGMPHFFAWKEAKIELTNNFYEDLCGKQNA